MRKIGFIGLGVMGKPMAANLIKAGHKVTVYDQFEAPVKELAEQGAAAAANIKQLVGDNEIIITMLPNSPHVQEVIIDGEHALIRYLKPGTIVIDMSSISPGVTQDIYSKLKQKGIEYMDAPVSGGYVGAVAGSLSIMVGGDAPVFEQVKDVLACMGKRITYLGSAGAGQTTKICNQIMVAGTITTMSESLALGKKAGLNMNQLLEVLTSGGANCWHLENKAPKMIEGNFAPSFKTSLLLKDIRLATEKAEQEGLNLEVLKKSQEMYERLMSDLEEDLDYTVIVKQVYSEF